jgi:hypothetical protein
MITSLPSTSVQICAVYMSGHTGNRSPLAVSEKPARNLPSRPAKILGNSGVRLGPPRVSLNSSGRRRSRMPRPEHLGGSGISGCQVNDAATSAPAV